MRELNNPIAPPQSNPGAWITYAGQLKQALLEVDIYVKALEERMLKLEKRNKK